MDHFHTSTSPRGQKRILESASQLNEAEAVFYYTKEVVIAFIDDTLQCVESQDTTTLQILSMLKQVETKRLQRLRLEARMARVRYTDVWNAEAYKFRPWKSTGKLFQII